MGGKEEEFIRKAFSDNWVVPLGPDVDAFELALENFLLDNPENSVTQDSYFRLTRDKDKICRKKISALSSGTAAIHLALVELGIRASDEVIVQNLTFSASANPVTYQGATPVFVDSENSTWNIDPSLLEEAISDRLKKTGKLPKAIIPVHLFGMPAQMDAIMEIASKWQIPVVEDAAEAFGSRYKGQMCGTFGRFGVLSFNGNKMITTSGGGALVCPDSGIKRDVIKYATQSRESVPWYEHQNIGYNYRLSNISAAIGRGQMFVAEEYIAHHRWVQSCYREAFSTIPQIRLHENPSQDYDSNFWLSTITFEEGAKVKGNDGCGNPEAMRRRLDMEGIETRHIWKPMHLQPVFKDCPAYTTGVAEKIFESGLCIPAGPWVGEKEIFRIITAIKQNLG
ncbi:MAG: DegT/DnrJ/EryC1/StrS family aminotransferase [Muribaculaceae bacterium]|nr:DegT/DnrJ/EryC1/StrS family aminotransferase [Muribaculaceae bacterium]